MTKRHLLVVGLISVLMLLLAGCTTSFEEWSGNMSNETGRHVKAYDENQPDDNSQSIQPATWLGAVTIKSLATPTAVRSLAPSGQPCGTVMSMSSSGAPAITASPARRVEFSAFGNSAACFL